MTRPRPANIAATPAPTKAVAVAKGLMIAACALVLGLLSVRPLTSEDLGYHIIYGQQFWQHGRIVDYNPFLYALPAADADPADRPAPAAGSWYDEQGRYRFPNANWLTQVIFAGIYALGAWPAMNALLVALVWGTFVTAAVLMRRLRVPLAAGAIGVLLMALMGYVRFTLRPELPALIVLGLQACLLARLTEDPDRPVRWPLAAGLVGLQLALVNLHISFYIGLGLTGAVVAGDGLRWLWAVAAKTNAAVRTAAAKRTRIMLALLAVQVAVCFINPWTWRLAALPLQTTWYMHTNSLMGAGTHPWTELGETARTFPSSQWLTNAWQQFLTEGFRGDAVRALLSVTLGLAAIGVVVTVVQRRFARALWILAGAYVSLTMFRAIPFGAMLMVPAVWAAFARALTPVFEKARRARAVVAVAAAVVVLPACAYLTTVIIDGRFYMRMNQVCFGLGRSRAIFPEAPAKWLSEKPITGHILTDFVTSSNLYFLMDPPRRPVPVLTNIWAYPPDALAEVFDAYRSRTGLAAFDAKYGLSAIVFRTDRLFKMLTTLRGSPDWALAYLDGAHAIFLSRKGPDAALAEREAINPMTWDVSAFLQRAEAEETWPGYAMRATGVALIMLRWTRPAVRVLERAVAVDPTFAAAWRDLGYALANRSIDRGNTGDDAGRIADLTRAIEALTQSLELQEDDIARQRRAELRRRLGQSRRPPSTPSWEVSPARP